MGMLTDGAQRRHSLWIRLDHGGMTMGFPSSWRYAKMIKHGCWRGWFMSWKIPSFEMDNAWATQRYTPFFFGTPPQKWQFSYPGESLQSLEPSRCCFFVVVVGEIHMFSSWKFNGPWKSHRWWTHTYSKPSNNPWKSSWAIRLQIIKHSHRCPFPIGWLMKIEGFVNTPFFHSR